jgi:thioredoxin reductase (NADPH)
MSQYLATRVSQLGNVDIRTGTDVVELEANSRLRAAVLSSTEGTARVRLPIESLFVCIGGVPRTQGLTTLDLAANEAGYLRTGAEVSAESGNESRWPLSRPPLPLETNQPGLFAAGDVRSGSIKRCSAAIGEGSMAVALVHRRLAEVGGE